MGTLKYIEKIFQVFVILDSLTQVLFGMPGKRIALFSLLYVGVDII